MGCPLTKYHVSNRTGMNHANMGSQCLRTEYSNSLHRAIRQSNFQKARNLILRGADVNCMNFIGGTPLIQTCRSMKLNEKTEEERKYFVMFLLQNGSEVDKSDIYGWTALLYAKENNHRSIAMLLEGNDRRKTRKSVTINIIIRKKNGGTTGRLTGVMVFNPTFNNISVISRRSVLLVEETEVPSENHR